MSELNKLTISQLREGYKNKEFNPVEITQAYINEIEKYNDTLNTYVCITADKAMEMAKLANEKWNKNNARPLEGVPVGVKDLYATKDVHTQACSNILKGFKPTYESTVTQNLWNNGAIMLGKCNMDEFAMGSSNENSCYKTVENPWRAKDDNSPRVAGGSSGGSAAAVASNLCAAATASDTGGSIRQPAAFTGTVGIKPTYGRCSRRGMVAFASSLDQAGPIAKNTTDAAIMLSAMAGYDKLDATSINEKVPDYEKAIGKSVSGMTVGIPKEYRVDGMDTEIEKLWEKGIEIMKNAGAKIKEISLPHTKYALPAYYIVAPAEASSNLARYDGVRYGMRVDGNDINELYENTRDKGFGDEVKRRIMIGTYVLSAGYYDAYYLKAQKVRSLIKKDFENVFAENVDAILTPATPSAAFGFNDKQRAADPIKMYLNDVFTVTANMAGIPAICVPAGLDKTEMPLGLQFIAPPFKEEMLFQMGNVIEKEIGQLKPNEWWKK